MNATLRARAAAARHARAAAGQVALAPRRAARRDERRARARHELPRRGRHALVARRRPGARRARRGARRRRWSIDGPGLRGAAAGAAIDVGNAGTLLRLLPGWLAGQPTAAAGRSTATRASAAGRSTAIARPLAAMGARARGARGPLHAARDHRRGRCTGSSTRCRSPPRRSSAACCSPACSPTGATTVVEPEPSRDHTERLLTARRRRHDAATATAITVTPPRRARARRDPRPGRPVVGRLPRRRGRARPRLAAA